jgi:hypothetical protein
MRNRDFEYLSEYIFEKTKISISVSTVKRIWNNSPHRIPHVSTLNALVQLLDYENWQTFKIKNKIEIHPEPEKVKRPFHLDKRLRFVFILCFSAGIICLGYVFSKHWRNQHGIPFQEIKESNVLFTSKKTVTSGLPNTVVFQYDIGNIKFDSAFIQQDWDPRRRIRIAENDHFHTCIYYYPGHYTAKLVINDKVIKKHPLFITTENWMAVYKKKPFQEIPVFLKNTVLIKKGRLLVSIDDLERNKINNDKDFYIGFSNYKDFGEVYGDNFTFETIVKNNPEEGGLTCQYTLIEIVGYEGKLTATFCERGCTSNLFLSFSDVHMEGAKNDLSALGVDLTDWRKIKYEVKNKQSKIFIDGREVYKLMFKRDIGKIIGINYIFYGCGTVKAVKLCNKKDEVMFEDNFK